MSKKTGKDTLPTMKIQGRDYVLVKDRIMFFNEQYPNGAIETELVSHDNGQMIVKAVITPDGEQSSRRFTGYSQAVEGQGMVNKTAALENAETSAVGRALAFMGIGVVDSIASADEMHKAGAGNREAVQAQNAKTITQMGVSPKDVEDSLKGNPENLPWEGDTPPCDVCGQPTTHKTGTSAKGRDWEALFCTSGDKSHAKWL